MNLNSLEWFNEWLNILEKYFSIVITFSYNSDIKYNEKYTYIKVTNKGADIGPKMIVSHYLKDFNYKTILFLHSKSNKIVRDKYLSKMLISETNIKFLSEQEIDGIFPDILQYGTVPLASGIKSLASGIKSLASGTKSLDKNKGKWGINEYHVNRLNEHYNITNLDYLFTEGNYYSLSKRVCNKIFNDFHIYQQLNTVDTFDYNWFIHFYHYKNLYIGLARSIYRKKKLHGNNFSTGLGHKGLPDGMIEHAFERIILNSTDGNFIIL